MRIFNKKNVLVILIFVLSVIMFLFFLNQNFKVSYYDEAGYLVISDLILKNGLFNAPNELRTYLYSLLIAIFKLFSDGNLAHVKIAFSVFQYAVFVLTIWFVAKKAKAMSENKIMFYTILVLGLLNPYLIQSTTLFLTDILAACCISISLILLTTSDLNKIKNGIWISLLAYSAVMIRPSSLIFLLPFFAIACYRLIIIKDFKPFKLILSGILCFVVFFPQIYNNIIAYNHWTILLHTDLMKAQTEWAVQYLKYGTVVIEGESPALFFKSPFDSSGSMMNLLISHLIQFIVVYSSHIFGVLDWGIIDTYIKNFTSPSRWVASLFLYSSWFLIFCGIIHQMRKKNFVSMSFLFSALVYLLFIGLTAVESRFGYPLYLILLYFAGWGIEAILKWRSRRWIIICSYLLMIVMFFYLSHAIDATTGRIEWF